VVPATFDARERGDARFAKAGRVCFVGVDVEVERKAGIHANDDVAERRLALTTDRDSNHVAIADAKRARVIRARMQMPVGEDHTMIDGDIAARTA
jgi:hypothetical protein